MAQLFSLGSIARMDNLAPFKIVGGLLLASAFVIAIFIVGKRYVRRLPPAMSYPIHTLLSSYIHFTIAIVLVSLGSPFFFPFGVALAIAVVSLWLPERLAIIFAVVLPLMLGYTLLSIFSGLQAGEPIFKIQKISDISMGINMVVWFFGMLFVWHRWKSGRVISGDKLPEPSATVPPVLRKP